LTHISRARGLLVAFALVALATAPSAHGQAAAVNAPALLAKAAQYDRQAKKDDRSAKKEKRRARLATRKAKRAKKPAVRRRLRRSAKRHTARARAYRKRAARCRRRAASLRRRAATPPPVHAAVAPPRRPAVPLGTAVDWNRAQRDSALRTTFLTHFDQMTPENELKLFALQPREGQFDFDRADAMVNWALSNGKRVRGHVLVYGNQLPNWLANPAQPWTRDELIQIMKDHIQTVMRHFQGRIKEWDVVNEAVVDYGNGWTPNLWYQVIGPDYVELAFRYAREADPGARLFYNDNGIDLPDHPHTVRLRALLSDLLKKGTPINAVGMQNHMSNKYKADGFQVAQSMRGFEALGLDVAVTEMDVPNDNGLTGDAELSAQRDTFLGAAWACRTEPRCLSFSTWGVTDKYSWIDPVLTPLMFDGSYNPKPAWYAVEDWIKKP
jgi:GH35 family endo-1,4-beta-xylanase